MRTLLILVIASLLSGTARAEAVNLAEVYQLAIQNDPQIGAAEAAYLARSEIVPQTRAGLLPSIVLSGSYSEENRSYPGVPESVAPSSSFPTERLSAGMNQPLFRADRWFQYQQAKAIRTQAGAIRDGEGLELIVRVADTYFTILERQDGLNAAMAEQNAVKRQLEQVQQRFDVGLVAITDVLESRAGFDSATVNVIEAEGAQTRSFEPLVRLTGRTFDEIYPLQQAFPVRSPEPANEEAWVNAAMASNALVLQAKAGVEAARKQVRINQSRHLPTLDAQVSWSNQKTDNTVFTLPEVESEFYAVNLTIPVFSGGATRSGVKQAQFQLDEAQNNLDLVERQTAENTRALFSAINTDVARVKARLQGIESSRSALAATQTGYEVGTRNIVDVLLAQQRLFLSEFQFASARYQYIKNTLRLKQLVGSLDQQDLVELNRFIDVSRSVTQVKPLER